MSPSLWAVKVAQIREELHKKTTDFWTQEMMDLFEHECGISYFAASPSMLRTFREGYLAGKREGEMYPNGVVPQTIKGNLK